MTAQDTRTAGSNGDGRGAAHHESPTYSELLRLEDLLNAARLRDATAPVLFLATHQSAEIWFGIVLRHLEEIRTALTDDDPDTALHLLPRLPEIFELLIRHFDMLATLSTEEFGKIRAGLGTASGFQSAQYREIEFLCGLRDHRHLSTPGFTEAERRRLRERARQPSVAEAYQAFRNRCANGKEAERIGEALLRFDERVTVWRARHAALAERFLGSLEGTAGTAGADYLWRVTRHRLFPAEAWGAG